MTQILTKDESPPACGGGSVEAKNEKAALARTLNEIELPAQSRFRTSGRRKA